MLDPTTLFSYSDAADTRRFDTLIVTVGSFVDAGNAQARLEGQLLNRLPSRIVGAFDADQLLDYREQRPVMTFDRDRFTDYVTPQFVLHEVTDLDGRRFGLLTGPEPALQWERFAASIGAVADELGVALTVIATGVPMPAPHTRPVLVTRHASDSRLLPGHQPTFGRIQLLGAFPMMLEHRLGASGHDVIGLSAHVPQYLAQSDYPDASIALLDAIGQVTGLVLPAQELTAAATVAHTQIEAAVAESAELRELVGALETNHDEFTSHQAESRELPTADEIGAEAEEFLRNLDDQ